MPRFYPILIRKIEEDNVWQRQQEQLKSEAGIDDRYIVIRKKGVWDYGLLIIRGIVYIAFIMLGFIGLITVLNPFSRQIINNLLLGM